MMDHMRFLLFFLSSILVVVVFFPAVLFCQPSDDQSSNGDCQSYFQCANQTEISYPFYNQDPPPKGPLLCGYPEFNLDCTGSIPILHIPPVNYRVLHFDFLNHTLMVARQDLWDNPCRPDFTETFFNESSVLFKISPAYKYTNITLYYDCSGSNNNAPPKYHFTCNGTRTGITTTNIFRPGIASSTWNYHLINCRQQIRVPVLESAARALETSTASPRDALRAALASGFPIQWFAYNDDCLECSRKEGKCAYYQGKNPPRNSSRFSCYHPPNERPVLRGNQPDSIQRTPPQVAPSNGSPVNHPAANNDTKLSPKLDHKAYDGTRLILGLAFGGVGFILAIILISWLCKRQHCPTDPTNPNIEKFILQQESLSTKRYGYSEIRKITKSFTDKLGQGGYGSVYKGILSDGSPVAVKLLFETDSNDEEFINEVASISRTSHVNIVSLLGFCYERKKRALVYEFMPNQSLDKFIRNADTSQDVQKLYSISIGVAKGLEYLHTGCKSRIVHFDIKPQNILLDENFSPKISDFGLAKLCKKKQSILSVEGMRGTTGYIAPEVFSRNFGGVSHKSDVYSYGIMLLEMAGAKKFAEPDGIDKSEYYFADKFYEHVITGHVRNVDYDTSLLRQEDDERLRKMCLVGFWCMQTMPSDRPSISKVVEMLEGNVEHIQIPPKPFLFNPGQIGEGSFSSLPIISEIETCTEISYSNSETTMKNSTQGSTSRESKR